MHNSRIEEIFKELRARTEKESPEDSRSVFIEGTAHALMNCMALMEGWTSYRESFLEWVILKSGVNTPINTLINNIDDVLLTCASNTFRMNMDDALRVFNRDWSWVYLHRVHDKIANRVIEMIHDSKHPNGPIGPQKEAILGFIELCNINNRVSTAGINDWLEVHKENTSEK